MATKTIKTLREEASVLLEGGVKNYEQLAAALPALIALQDAIAAAKKHLDASKEVARALSAACSKYAHEHTEYVFNLGFSVSPIGVESGDMGLDGRVYHFLHGFDGYMCSEQGKTISQKLLAELPEGLAKSKLELDVTALNKADLDNEELEKIGLMRKVKEVWTELESV